ncbi:MAG: class II glutamine amidotransferase [Olsenella sp.]|jgi:glutamine amidotransferase|nr:class II glutamine amidotransferase [Olsenella sp.]
MCELFAINSGRPVLANAYLREFYTHSHDNPHGWGLSWRDDHGKPGDPEADVVLWREPIPAYGSALLPKILDQPVEACRLEAHIRFSTCGTQSVENCHPFLGSDISGREWTLIHNGILFNEELLAGYERIECGETDSERAMLFLLDVLDEATMRTDGALDFNGTFDALASALSQISNLNRLNLIMDDGTYTYVHTNTSEDTLNFRQLSDDAIVFSTKPLGGDAEKDLWKPVPRNRLIAYRDGRLVRASAPHGYTFCEAILDLRKKFGDAWPEVIAS